MDKLKEKFKQVIQSAVNISRKTSISFSIKSATACKEVTKEVVKKFDDWRRNTPAIFNPSIDKYEIWIGEELRKITFDELFELFLEQNEI